MGGQKEPSEKIKQKKGWGKVTAIEREITIEAEREGIQQKEFKLQIVQENWNVQRG